MKYLIVGLGNFGSTLAEELTDLGHDVIGVDINESCVDAVKDKISLAYIMNATDRIALSNLPLNEMDCVIVAIGQSMEHSLRVVASLKELSVESIYARALDSTHESILRAMNINHIFIPEIFAARKYASKIVSKEI